MQELKNHNIYPTVCIGLSEVGRDFVEEFSLAKPQENLTEYLKSVLMQEIQILETICKGYKHYISTAWTTDPYHKKGLISFIDQDIDNCQPVFTVGNGIYDWLADRRRVFKFSKQSFVEAIANKQQFEDRLLTNQYMNKTLHLDKSTSDIVYQKYFEHVFYNTQEKT